MKTYFIFYLLMMLIFLTPTNCLAGSRSPIVLKSIEAPEIVKAGEPFEIIIRYEGNPRSPSYKRRAIIYRTKGCKISRIQKEANQTEKDTRWNENKIEKFDRSEINLRGTSSGEVGVVLFTYQIANPGVYDIGCKVRFKRKRGGASNPAYTVIVVK